MNELKQNNPKVPWWQPSLLLFSKLSGWIIGPVILGIILGKWLDRKFHSEPWLFLTTVGLAFAISMFGIIHDSVKEMKRIEKEDQKQKGESQK